MQRMRRRFGHPLMVGLLAAVPFLLANFPSRFLEAMPPQQGDEISPLTTPEIIQVKPNQGATGNTITVVIEGHNFSRGAYTSFLDPGLHVLSAQRSSSSQLVVTIEISAKVHLGTQSLFVSNPASAVAETTFSVSASGSHTAQINLPPVVVPELKTVDPARVIQVSEAMLRVTGNNFSQGVKVRFTNPGIQVLSSAVNSPAELMVRIRAAPDAQPGQCRLIVTNPDTHLAELAFEVVERARDKPAAPVAKTKPPQRAKPGPQRFEVYDLGEAVSVLQHPNQQKGLLTLSGGKLKYEREGKVAFSTATREITEIGENSVLGLETGTFHITLKSGKTFNFTSAELSIAETQRIVNTLRDAMR